MYTIAYRVQYTSTRVHARIPNGHPRDDPRKVVSEDVLVGVGVRVGAVECQLIASKRLHKSSWFRQTALFSTYPMHCVLRKLRYGQKWGQKLLSETLSKILDLKKFVHDTFTVAERGNKRQLSVYCWQHVLLPVDHTQRPALSTTRLAIGCDAASRGSVCASSGICLAKLLASIIIESFWLIVVDCPVFAPLCNSSKIILIAFRLSLSRLYKCNVVFFFLVFTVWLR